jgi:hypothetical protein
MEVSECFDRLSTNEKRYSFGAQFILGSVRPELVEGFRMEVSRMLRQAQHERKITGLQATSYSLPFEPFTEPMFASTFVFAIPPTRE